MGDLVACYFSGILRNAAPTASLASAIETFIQRRVQAAHRLGFIPQNLAAGL